MTELTDDFGTYLTIRQQPGPHRGIKATISIFDGMSFKLDEASCREIRDTMDRLLDWDNSHRKFDD